MGIRRICSWLASIGLVAVSALLVGTVAAWAAPVGGSLGGTVTGDAAMPLESVGVYVYGVDGTTMGDTATDASGDWSILLPPGDYKVYFSARTYNFSHTTDSYQDQYYGGGREWNSATPITVESEADTVADVSLEPGCYVSGTVTASGVPVEGIVVEVFNDSGIDMSVDTDENGEYAVAGLPAGDYTVWFDSSWYNWLWDTHLCPEYYDNVYDEDDATPVSISVGAGATGIDAELEVGGSISGTVTDGSTPLENVYATLLDLDGNWLGNVVTSEEGTYTISGISPGDYLLSFDPSWYNSLNSASLLAEYYDDATDFEDATPITVAAATDIPDIDAVLGPGGDISGTVTVGAEPIEGIWVWLYQDNNYVTTTYTDLDGNYVFLGLAPGEYQVEFYTWSYNSDHSTSYLSEYYDNARDRQDATPVLVESGVTTADIDADLEIGGIISGTVTGDGGPLEGISVWASTVDDDWGGGAYTDSDGNYQITTLPQDDYIVGFDPSSHNDAHAASFLEEFYDDVREYEQATLVPATYGTETTGIDADLEVGGSISGTVTGDGGPLAEVDVSVWDEQSDVWQNTTTDSEGNYTVRGLLAGDYEVEFSPGWHNELYSDSFLAEYYDDVTDPDDATLVPVSLAENVAGIDADLEIGASIGGMVTGDGAAPLNGVLVTALGSDGTYVDGTWTNSGEWVIRGLTPGDYVVAYSPVDLNHYEDTSYKREYWNDKATFESADPVAVTFGGELLDMDAQLSQGGGAIAGTVYEPDGTTPLSMVEVSVYELTPGGEDLWVGYDYSEADGSYEVSGLAAGSYYVEFYADHGAYLSMVYDAAPRVFDEVVPYYALGTPVDVANGETTAGIDAVMQTPANLYGSVEDIDGLGLEDIAVTLWYDAGDEGWTPVHTHYTDFDGTFDFSDYYCGLLPGDYKVQFTDEQGDLGEAWYLDAATAEDAQTLTIVAGEDYTLDPQVMPVEPEPSQVTYTAIEGATRVSTAVSASKAAFPDGASTVIVATGYNWPDALGGSALAGVMDAPLLLTATDALPDEVAEEIGRLEADNAIILGQTGAVDAEVEDALKALLGDANVERIGGANRYETSRMVAARCVDEQGDGYDGTAFLATGLNFPDQIAAAPLAAGNGWPIYLTDPAHPGAAALLAAMRDDGVTDVLVLGGTGAVSNASMQAVVAGVPCTGTRLGGVDRYDTATIVASYGVTDGGMSWDGVAITTGKSFPDGLVGGVLQGKTGSVLVLTSPTTLYSGVATVLADNKDSIHEVRFLGGTAAVSDTVRTQVAHILE